MPRGRSVSVFEIGVERSKIRKTNKFGNVNHFHVGGHKQVLCVTQLVVDQKFVRSRAEFFVEQSCKLHAAVIEQYAEIGNRVVQELRLFHCFVQCLYPLRLFVQSAVVDKVNAFAVQKLHYYHYRTAKQTVVLFVGVIGQKHHLVDYLFHLRSQLGRKSLLARHFLQCGEETVGEHIGETFYRRFPGNDVDVSYFFRTDFLQVVGIGRGGKEHLPCRYGDFLPVKHVVQFAFGKQCKFPVVVMSVRGCVVKCVDVVGKIDFVDKILHAFACDIVVGKFVIYHDHIIPVCLTAVNVRCLIFALFSGKNVM